MGVAWSSLAKKSWDKCSPTLQCTAVHCFYHWHTTIHHCSLDMALDVTMLTFPFFILAQRHSFPTVPLDHYCIININKSISISSFNASNLRNSSATMHFNAIFHNFHMYEPELTQVPRRACLVRQTSAFYVSTLLSATRSLEVYNACMINDQWSSR